MNINTKKSCKQISLTIIIFFLTFSIIFELSVIILKTSELSLLITPTKIPKVMEIKTNKDIQCEIEWNKTTKGLENDLSYYTNRTTKERYSMTSSKQCISNIDIHFIKICSDTLEINHPNDIIYAEGTQGHNITWNPSGNDLLFYIITMNGFRIATGFWNNGSIFISVDDLSVGYYLFNCTIYNQSGNEISDTVKVTVLDVLPPTIDHLSDFTYEKGPTGYVITWNPTDSNPSKYIITRDGLLVANSAWDGGSINVWIGGLSRGIYSYNCTVYDKGGNSVSDIVQVIVTDRGFEIGTTEIIIISAYILIGVGLIIFISKKQKSHL